MYSVAGTSGGGGRDRHEQSAAASSTELLEQALSSHSIFDERGQHKRWGSSGLGMHSTGSGPSDSGPPSQDELPCSGSNLGVGMLRTATALPHEQHSEARAKSQPLKLAHKQGGTGSFAAGEVAAAVDDHAMQLCAIAFASSHALHPAHAELCGGRPLLAWETASPLPEGSAHAAVALTKQSSMVGCMVGL